MKKTIWIIGGLVVLSLLILKIADDKYSDDNISNPVKIGAALALTGDAAPWGEVSRNAIQLAVDEINGAGGINGATLEVRVEDIKSNSKDSVSAVSKLVNIDKVDSVMITWLDSFQGSEAVVPKDMLLISQDAAIESVNVPNNHDNVFSLWYRTEAKAKIIVDDMLKSGVKSVSFYLLNDSYYATLATFLKAEAEEKGIKVLSTEMLNPDTDTRTTVTKISSSKPDAVFFGSYDEKLSVDFLKRYHEIIAGKTPLYGDEFIEQNFRNKNFNVAWLEHVHFYVPADSDAEFIKKYEKKFGTPPVFSAQTTYDTVYVIAEYLKHKSQDLTEFMKSHTFDTLTYGPITFDEIGGVVSKNPAIMMKQIKDGKIVNIHE
ncbi:MAG TPA: ABC transporter substrate-binding protein [Candidatus Paceibacterota bacterium]|nr:ABC transporter substrate-binding protein [Candidatus Paceibacterota bacterium]